MTVKVTTIYWRDIPAQIICQVGRERKKVKLPDRFQGAIDRAAMRAGKGSSADYLNDWRRESVPMQGTIDDVSSKQVDHLIKTYTHALLKTLILSGGQMPSDSKVNHDVGKSSDNDTSKLSN